MAAKKRAAPAAKTATSGDMVPINFRIEPWMVAALDEVVEEDAAQTRGRFLRSDLIREVLATFLESRGKRAPK